MSSPTLTRDGDVFVLDLGDGENRLSPPWVRAFDAALDEVDAAPAPRALVTTATGKTWSQGLDLDRLHQDTDRWETCFASVHALLARLLVLPVPCVAAVGGHCFGAGAMLALAHDSIVMRQDRGYFCLPEIDLGLPFTVGMSALVTARLTPATAHEAMTTGRRYGGTDAVAAGIVAAAVPAAEVVPAALARAGGLAAKDARTLGAIKSGIYRSVLAALQP